MHNFVELFLPRLCACCGQVLLSAESIVCTSCQYYLPYTDFHLHEDNLLERQFRGRVKTVGASSCFYYQPKSGIGKLIHALKYADRPQIGRWLGCECSKRMPLNCKIDCPDIIIPVPLHQSRQAKRGYNQSEQIAIGIAKNTGIPLNGKVLRRVYATTSQTGMHSRFSRHENVKSSFEITNPEIIKNKHLLLVDDVITTGATIEACAMALSAVEGVRISILSAAHTF